MKIVSYVYISILIPVALTEMKKGEAFFDPKMDKLLKSIKIPQPQIMEGNRVKKGPEKVQGSGHHLSNRIKLLILATKKSQKNRQKTVSINLKNLPNAPKLASELAEYTKESKIYKNALKNYNKNFQKICKREGEKGQKKQKEASKLPLEKPFYRGLVKDCQKGYENGQKLGRKWAISRVKSGPRSDRWRLSSLLDSIPSDREDIFSMCRVKGALAGYKNWRVILRKKGGVAEFIKREKARRLLNSFRDPYNNQLVVA